jgi:hypothetical protein
VKAALMALEKSRAGFSRIAFSACRAREFGEIVLPWNHRQFTDYPLDSVQNSRSTPHGTAGFYGISRIMKNSGAHLGQNWGNQAQTLLPVQHTPSSLPDKFVIFQ